MAVLYIWYPIESSTIDVFSKNTFVRQCNRRLFTPHLHHFLADEKQECVQIGNGSLIGADDYSHKLRVRSKPSQNLVIACKDNLTEFICKINV